MKIVEIKTVIAFEDKEDVEKIMEMFQDLETIYEDDGFTMLTCESEITYITILELEDINIEKEDYDKEQIEWFGFADGEILKRLPNKSKIYGSLTNE